MSDAVAPAIRISVVVCAFNAKDRLEDTLASLAVQSMEHCLYEVLVIDNASTDGTGEWLEQRRERYGYRVVMEPELGLSAARNRGIRESRGELIYFIDDDAVAPPFLLERLWEAYIRHDRPAGVGGAVHGLWEGRPPEWLTASRWGALSLLWHGARERELRYPEILIGCNCGWARRVFDQYGLFDTGLGRRGKNLVGNEERDLQQRLAQAGERVVYTPGAMVFHKVPPGRMELGYFVKRKADGVASDLAMAASAGAGADPAWKRALRPLHEHVGLRLRSLARALRLAAAVYTIEMKLVAAGREGRRRFRGHAGRRKR